MIPRCPICRKTFASFEEVDQHVAEMHSDAPPMTDELKRLHEAAGDAEATMGDFTKWGLAAWHAYADGSLIPAERYQALVEAAEAMERAFTRYLDTAHLHVNGRQQRDLYPDACAALDALRAALKEER